MKHYLHGDIVRDLILLENQIPFFVLEKIYKLANINRVLELPPFITIAIHYFEDFIKQNSNSVHFTNPKLLEHFTDVKPPEHFTDLLRTFLLPLSLRFPHPEKENTDHAKEQVYSESIIRSRIQI
jgi:hypothetical protein